MKIGDKMVEKIIQYENGDMSMDEIVSNIDNQFLKDRLHQCLNDVMREYDIARGIRDTDMPYPYTFIVEVMIFLFVY